LTKRIFVVVVVEAVFKKIFSSAFVIKLFF
jgi:hypothetical protein